MGAPRYVCDACGISLDLTPIQKAEALLCGRVSRPLCASTADGAHVVSDEQFARLNEESEANKNDLVERTLRLVGRAS